MRARQEGIYNIKCILLDLKGCLWGKLRKEAFAMLSTTKENSTIQQNSFYLLEWFADELGEAPNPLSDQQILGAIYNAITAQPLNIRASGSLDKIMKNLAEHGITLQTENERIAGVTLACSTVSS